MPTSNAAKYIYSFSGSDVTNISWYSLFFNGEIHNSSPGSLESLTTVSFSVHEAKMPVRSLGYRAAKSYTGGIRTIAGNIIMSVIRDHPLRTLMDQYNSLRSKIGFEWNWSIDKDNDGSGFAGALSKDFILTGKSVFPTVLPPFNIAFFANNEIDFKIIDESFSDPNSSARVNWDFKANQLPFTQLILFGVEFIDDGLVISTNNPMTEMTFQFVARDYAVLSTTDSFNVTNTIDAAGLSGLVANVGTFESSQDQIMSTATEIAKSDNRQTIYTDPLTGFQTFTMEAGDTTK